MPLLLAWVKDNWRFVAGLVAVIFVFGFGYYRGYSHEHANYTKHLQADATLMAVAKAENERRVAEQAEITNRLTKDYKDEVNKLNDYYKSHPRIIRLCTESSKTDTLSAKSKSSSGVDTTTKGITQTPASIEVDLLIAGKEIKQCQALIEWELEQDRVK